MAGLDDDDNNNNGMNVLSICFGKGFWIKSSDCMPPYAFQGRTSHRHSTENYIDPQPEAGIVLLPVYCFLYCSLAAVYCRNQRG